jgi:WD40 repeat protein
MQLNPASPLGLNAPYPQEIPGSVNEPYVGPRSFQKDQRGFFFGRDEEAEELVSLITAHPVVLLYSQSGAGKTSLLNANLIPRLEETEHFNVLPPMRVQGQLPSSFKIPKKANIFVLNALTSCCKTDTNGFKPGTTFAEYLSGIEKKTNQYGEPAPIVIVFDQFEELFTSYGGRWADREDFFVQLGEAMEGNAKKGIKANPLLRVVFCMREDFIAELDPYESFLPEKLRTRFRLEHLRSSEALAAIKNPIEKTDRSYAPGVAEQLVKNLLKIPSQSMTGTQTIGLYVEPVQLQVVCQSIWEALTPDENVITKKHLEKYGDVSEALSKFYERSIRTVAGETGVKEETLRRWFADVLITPEGTRAPVNRGQEHTGGMPNNAVDKLEAVRLIKGEWKGATVRWYELAHDRFIEPIRKSNEAWLGDQSRGEQVRLRLEAKASKWKQGSPLLSADELLEAQRLVRTQVASASLRTLVDASRASSQRKRIRFFKLVGVGSAMAAVIFLVVAVFAFTQRRAAQSNEAKAKSRLLAIKGRMVLEDNPELSVLLAKAAKDLADSRDARDVIRSGLLKLSTLKASFRHDGAKVSSAEFSPDGRLILTRTADGKVRLWDEASKKLVKQIGEDAEINRAKFSPDGKFIVTAENSKLARVWDAGTGTFLRELKHHSAAVNAVAFSPDSKYIGTASDDNTACVWNAATGQLVEDLRGHSGRVIEIAFSPDGVNLATEASDETARIWNLENKKKIELKGLSGPIAAIAFSRDGTLLATETSTEAPGVEEGDYAVLVWDVATGKQKFKLQGHDEPIAGIAFSGDSQYILTFSGDRVKLWYKDGFNKTELRHPKAESQEELFLSSASFSPDSKYVVTTSADKTVRVWNVDDGTEISLLLGHSRAVNSAAFSSDGKLLLTAGDDQTVREWPLEFEGRPKASGMVLPHMAGVSSAAFNSDGTDVITSSQDEITLRSVGGKFPPVTFIVGNDRIRVADAVFSPNNQHIVAASGNQIHFFDVEELRKKALEIGRKQNLTPQSIHRLRVLKPNHSLALEQNSGAVFTVAYSPDKDKKLIVAATEDGKAVVWDADTKTAVGQIVHDNMVTSAVFSPDGKSILTACVDGYLRIWNAGNFAFEKNVGQKDVGVRAAQYSPDGRLIITSSMDAAYVLDVATGQRQPKFELKHKGQVYSAAFSPDSKFIATAGADKSTNVWDAKSGENITVLAGHKDVIREAVFSPDVQSILTASEDETARIHSRETFAPYNEIQQLINERVKRKLTPEEIDGYLNETAEATMKRQDSDLGIGSVFVGIFALKYHGDWRELCAELLSLLLFLR